MDFARHEDFTLADLACFCLASLSDNSEFHSMLCELGVIKLLVATIAANQESKHYASVALMRLSNNYENHIAITEEGGLFMMMI